MPLFDSISARLGGIGIGGKAMSKGINKMLTASDMEVAATVVCTTTSWARVGTFTVTPQTTQEWGYGKEGVEQANIGILTFLPNGADGTGVTIACAVRLAIVNAEDIVQDYRIPSIRVEELAKQLVDGKSLCYFLERRGYVAKPYDKLVLEILVDVASTYSTAASTLLVNTSLTI